MYWQSRKVFKPFDPLLLNMMVDALCSYHFSDLGVGSHVSSGLVVSFPSASHFTGCRFALQRLGHSPSLALVCECWGDDGVYASALCLHWDVQPLENQQ